MNGTSAAPAAASTAAAEPTPAATTNGPSTAATETKEEPMETETKEEKKEEAPAKEEPVRRNKTRVFSFASQDLVTFYKTSITVFFQVHVYKALILYIGNTYVA